MNSRSTTFTSGTDLIEITMPALGTAAEHVEREQHQFITDHWQGLAAAAYEGFRQLGIGAVVVEEPRSPADAANDIAAHTVRYATLDGAWLETTLTEPLVRWLEKQLQMYDPNESGLFIFLRDGAHPHLYRVSGTLSPPRAFEQVRSRLN